MIQGYSDDTSAFSGTTITLRVSTDAPQFRTHFYRQGASFEFQLVTAWQLGVLAGEHDAGADWSRTDADAPGWAGYDFEIPGEWRSGVYVAIFEEGDGRGNANPQQTRIDFGTADARAGKALVVVKNPTPGVGSQLLYKVPLFTYAAYNPKGGRSVYQGGFVSLHRPGNGTGGLPWDSDPTFIGGPINYDPFDPAGTFRQTFVHWDAKLIQWLEDPVRAYRLDYCTDLDIHNDSRLEMVCPYALILSVGHDEYYSENMRNILERYIAQGGNIAFFSGNTSYWRVVFRDPQRPLMFNRVNQWADPTGPNRPEDALTGVASRHAGEGDRDRPKRGYTVQHTDHWPFEHTGLNENSVIGENEGLVGYECDGAPFDRNAPRPVTPSFPPGAGTPPGFIILGTGVTDDFNDPQGNATATMGMYTRNGTAFTGATTDWPRVVWQGESRVARITRNVINRLGGDPKGLASLSNLGGVIACDGFFSGDDNHRHAIVGTGDGGVTEISFNPATGQDQTRLVTQAGLLDVGAFYSRDDQYRHVITATGDGNVWEIFFNPAAALGQALLGNFPKVTRVAGFFSGDDNCRHAIVATSDGGVFEIYFTSNWESGQVLIGSFDAVVDVGAFYSPDDRFRHVIVGTADGTVSEIYFNPDFGVGRRVIGNVPGLVRVSGYYAAADAYFNRRAQVLTDQGRIVEIRYHPDWGIMRVVLFNTGGLVDLGGFHSPDDNFRHAILAGPDGAIQDLFSRP
jgi:hypothetical protein